MTRVWACLALLAVGALLVPTAHVLADEGAPGRGGQVYGKAKPKPTQEEIARYFALYGGFIDPDLNKQTPAGPFDSGFFFNSGVGRNGGDSPYMH